MPNLISVRYVWIFDLLAETFADLCHDINNSAETIDEVESEFPHTCKEKLQENLHDIKTDHISTLSQVFVLQECGTCPKVHPLWLILYAPKITIKCL